MGFATGLIVGGVVAAIIQYYITRARNRGQFIRDAMKYSWRLVEKVRPKGDKENGQFIRVYEDGDKEEFINNFSEITKVFLNKYSVWY